jgi:hypothetical protein
MMIFHDLIQICVLLCIYEQFCPARIYWNSSHFTSHSQHSRWKFWGGVDFLTANERLWPNNHQNPDGFHRPPRPLHHKYRD